ncbi:MAG: phenylalanine--tRNA ligase subunit beta [Gemmatimonadota bacterium]|nr:MAG: phenylalanine--tRNA ligase subunit beta [Gemmatimonadota bacterium]
MPVIGVPVDRLNTMLREPVERETLLGYLEQLGCDVEGFATVNRFRCQRCGGVTEITEQEGFPTACDGCGADFTKGDGTAENVGQTEVIRMELLPVRPDMFDVGGLARTLRGYLGTEVGSPSYNVSSSGYSVSVDEGLCRQTSYRPNIVCAVVRGLLLDEELLKIIMKMQENLHWALGRDRKKASIGVYDLDTVVPDFHYKALANDEIRFVPLGGMPDDAQSREASPLEILGGHPKGTAYRHLLADFDRYPILMDSKGTVLSMPPIINSEDTRVSDKTKNLFIDVTGPEAKDVHRVLSVLVTSLTEFGGTIESVTVMSPKGEIVAPDLSTQTMDLDPKECQRITGIDMTAHETADLLRKMRHNVLQDGNRLRVEIAAYRTDIMHPVDLYEDVAIAYGYHNIPKLLVPTLTVGHGRSIEFVSSLARQNMIGLGFLEVITFMLTNPENHYAKLRMGEPPDYVTIENPSSIEQTMVRTHLISGILETFKLNRSQPTPQRIFELGDVCTLDQKTETGARDVRKIAAATMDPKTGFAEVKSVLESIAREIGLKPVLTSKDVPLFIQGRSAVLMVGDQEVGQLGEVHPEVLENFDLVQPVSLFELILPEGTNRSHLASL